MKSRIYSRREAMAAGLALGCAFGSRAEAAAFRKVAILGDSITAGYGLHPEEALPARLQGELARLGARARVIAAGVVGDTTAGAAARVERAVPPGTDLCIVAVGGNDLLEGEDPARVRANLDLIVRKLKARGIAVVLAGLQVPPLLRGAYASAFNAAFLSVARSQNLLFIPDMLAGVTLNPKLNQRDGIHPNAAGVVLIARRLAPVVARGLAGR